MKRYLPALTFLLFFLSCTSEDALPAPDVNDSDVEDVESYSVAGKTYVMFSDEMIAMIEDDLSNGVVKTKSAALNQTFEDLGIISVERLFPNGGRYEARRRAAGLHKWYIVTYDPTVSITKASTNLSLIEGVEIAEPVRRISPTTEVRFNDLNSTLWGLDNTENPAIDINVLPVWENYTVGSPNVVVAVVDSGADVNHPDLKANCISSKSYTNSKFTPEEHGTHVAGTIAAVGNNGLGICGVAGGDHAAGKKGVSIISSQIFHGEKVVAEASARAIADAADLGAVICQNSWGYYYDSNGNGQIDKDELEKAKLDKVGEADKLAIDYFIKNAGCDESGNQRPDSPMKGGLVVFAAGNDGISNAAPANYSAVIAVGAIGKDGRKADFSNYGSWVDIAAPGVDIISTIPGGEYKSMQGTSMACPHVSAVAALVLSYCGGPGFTADMLKEKLLKGMNTDENVIKSTDRIGGLLDAYGAITYGDNSVPEKVEDLSAEGRGNNIDLTWTQKGDSSDKPVYAAFVFYGKNKQDVVDATASSYSCEMYSHVINAAIGETVNCTLTGLDFSTPYYCKVVNYTYGLVYADPSEVIEVATTENNPPVIELQMDGPVSIMSHEKATVKFAVSDPDGHEVTVEYTSGSDADVMKRQADGSYVITFTGSAAPSGEYTGVITVKDQYGLSTITEVPYEIQGNHAPEKIKDIDDIFLQSRAQELQINMEEYVTDSDGEQLKYDLTVADEKVIFFTVKGNRIFGTPVKFGQTDVTVIAKDARGEKVEFKFTVIIKDPSDPVSVYPNPVTDYVNVGTLDLADTRVVISNSTGALLYDESSEISAKEPARIDMRGFAPGAYTMTVTFSGKEYKKTVIKL